MRALGTLDGLDEEGLGIGIIVSMDIVIGIDEVVEPAQTVVCQLVFLDACQNHLGLVLPAHRDIAQCLHQFCLGHSGRQPAEMLADVEKCRCRAEEVAVVVLASAHHHPCVVQEGVILLAAQPLLILGCVAAALDLGLLLD